VTPLEIWTIYDHPTDYPDCFVARKFLNDQPTDTVLFAPTLARIREMIPQGLFPLARFKEDDPVIVESWF
jgi:hypothetical protein